MNSVALTAYFGLASVQRWAEIIKAHDVTIYLLSFTVAAFTSFMMRMAYRRIRSEEWINYLAWTFFFLGTQYFVLLLTWFVTVHPNDPATTPSPSPDLTTFLILQILSTATNLCGVAAARDVQNRKPLFPDLSTWFRRSKVPATKRPESLVPRWCLGLAGISLLASIFVYTLQAHTLDALLPVAKDYPLLYGILGRSFESVFSAICLFWLGYVIFANLSNRRRPWIASAAFLFAIAYALVQIGFGLSPWLADEFIAASEHQDRLELFDSFLIGLALPLKIFLAVFAYGLVVRFFETLSDLRKLQDRVFDPKQDRLTSNGAVTRQDYLSSDGVVKLISDRLRDQLSIRERLRGYLSAREALKLLDQRLSVTVPNDSDNSSISWDVTHEDIKTGESGEEFPERGFVNLVIKLPGEKNKRLVCIFWPNRTKEKRAKTFDWQPENQQFSSLPHDEDKIEEGQKNARILSELMDVLPFAGIVLTNKDRKEIIWPEDNFESWESFEQYKGCMKAVANVAIQAHGAAIGCLQIARSKSPFSQMAIRQIREIANLLSPAVQAYRELAGLDLMSIRFAGAQAEESTYSPERAAEAIATILHDIFSPSVTRLCFDFGFSTVKPRRESDADRSHVITELEGIIKDKKWEDYPEDLTDSSFVKYRLLKKQLTARVTETFSHQPPTGSPDRFTMGNLILMVQDGRDNYDHAALGTTYLHRKTASTLVADAFLDFERDYYNDLLKRLGKELSEKRLNIDAWFEPIQRILTKDAGLSWVVARQRGRKERLGDKQGIRVLRELRCLKIKPPRRFKAPEPLEIKSHYYLPNLHSNSHHILKLRLPSADGFIWLGVERKNFGSELDFASPWKNFLVNFSQIADASLSRITFPEKFQVHLEAAQLQGIIASMATAGTVIHQFRNMIAGQLGSIRTLLNGIRLGELTDDPEYKQIIQEMNDSAIRMLDVFQSISRLTETDERQPCQLREAAQHAIQLYEVSLRARGVRTELAVDETIYVDVPFSVAALALATLVGNSKDAVKDKKTSSGLGYKNGYIRIEAVEHEDSVLCRVVDDGQGMTQAIRSRIFEPKDSAKQYGTGMGLYLTSHSLSENRSSIKLTKSDENGSEFTITFPLAKKEVEV